MLYVKSDAMWVVALTRRRGDSDMQHRKATAWGAGLMGMVGLAGAVLGPSPLLLPLAPLVGIAYVPFMFATAALGAPMGLAELGLGGKAAFVVWCGALRSERARASCSELGEHEGASDERRRGSHL